jgi:hypothetical protein
VKIKRRDTHPSTLPRPMTPCGSLLWWNPST